nr:hypothetical protein [Pedobacter sp. ASV19]
MKNKILILLFVLTLNSCGVFKKSEKEKYTKENNAAQSAEKETNESDQGTIKTKERWFLKAPPITGGENLKKLPVPVASDLPGSTTDLKTSFQNLSSEFGSLRDFMLNGGLMYERETSEKKDLNKQTKEKSEAKENKAEELSQQKSEPGANLTLVLIAGIVVFFLTIYLLLRSMLSPMKKDIQLLKNKS